MGHHHGHDHDKEGKELTFAEKAARLIDHWIHHNSEHAENYRRWADQFRSNKLEAAAAALEEAAGLTARIDQALRAAAAGIDAGRGIERPS